MHELSKLTAIELATIRAEKAELIEALIKIKSIAPIGSTWHYHASQTLAKYETK
jgi:hypothetical protein